MRPILILLVSVLLALPAAAQHTPLHTFEPLIGTWAGESTDPEQPGVSDVMQFEWVAGRHVVQHTHSIDNGSYGGTTIYFWDGNANDGIGGIIYHYFTTAGFHTQGTAWWEDGHLVAEEAVIGHPEITRVRSTMVMNEDGGWTSSSDYLSNGEWVDGHGFYYVPAPDEDVVFRSAE